MAERVKVRCDNCGQVDDHPKHHYGAQTFHHDCTPASVLDEMTSVVTARLDLDVFPPALVPVSREPVAEEDQHPGVRRFMEIRQAALDGTHGQELVAHIEQMHEGVRQDPEGQG